MCQLRSTFVLLLAACWLASDAAGARNRLLDGNDPLGSPGELAWQAWLLMDASAAGGGGGGGAAGESIGARRITPKSVFIAPAFSPQSLPACAEGTRRDAAGRCVQLVQVNRDAQLNFLLQRLNALHARPPAPLRFPLPFPPRGGAAAASDSGPFKVPLHVPPATPAPPPPPAPEASATSEAATTAAPPPNATASTAQPNATASTAPPSTESAPDPVAQDEGDDEPMRVSVVMADVTKRNSAEGEPNGTVQEDGDDRPLITVWTLENDTVHKSHSADAADSPFVVEIPTTTEAATSGAEDEKSAEQRPAPADVLAPGSADGAGGALPMLVISPGTTLAAASTTPRPDGEDDLVVERGEGSGAAAAEGGPLDDMATSTEQADDVEATPKNSDDEKETGSADAMEHVEVVPISEQSRHDLPILGEDQDTSFSQGGLSDGLTGIMRPIPLDVMQGSQSSKEDSTYGNPVRFPPESSDEPHTVHLFKGNYIKFPTEHVYRYKHKPVTEPLTDVKQSFWWLPSGWRVEQQRHQPALQDFWSRMPLNEDASLLSRYNPTYHSPLPYQQRQAQFDPEWASMKRQMSP